jgi:SAM-dependent methyltransferase
VTTPHDQTAFWDAAAGRKTFAHPFDGSRLASVAPHGGRVLDCGCGYGRTTAEVAALGWHAVGVDPSAGMLARARREHPGLVLVRAAPGPLPFQDASFDAATLFAVLTCIPEDAAQRALVAELRRVLRPGGGLYVSDLLLNDDARNRARYDAARGRGLAYGVFELPEGVVLRHHDPAWVDGLFREWTPVSRTEFVATTMNGHTSRAFQLVIAR